MEESQNSMAENIPQEDIKTGIEQVEMSSEPEQNEETGEGNSVLETRPSLDPAVKVFVEEFTQGDLKKMADSSYIARVEEVEKMVLVSDQCASLTNSRDSSVGKDAIHQESEQKKDGVSDALIEPPLMGTEETTLPISDENVTANDASSLLPADISSRIIENQPFVAATPQIRASWMSCCGLLDVLKGQDSDYEYAHLAMPVFNKKPSRLLSKSLQSLPHRVTITKDNQLQLPCSIIPFSSSEIHTCFSIILA